MSIVNKPRILTVQNYINDIVKILTSIENEDYDYSRAVQDLKDLSDGLSDRYDNYVEPEERC